MRLLCHCDNCRKVTGSSFMANAVYQKNVCPAPFKVTNFIELKLTVL
jgi:hypothetical protein